MNKLKILGFAIILMLGAGFVLLKPVPVLPEDQLLVLEATVEDVYEAGEFDIVFSLEGEETVFYINRGVELGLNIDHLRRQLLGRKVTFKYPDHTSLLLGNKIKHVSVVRYGSKTIFSECPKTDPVIKI